MLRDFCADQIICAVVTARDGLDHRKHGDLEVSVYTHAPATYGIYRPSVKGTPMLTSAYIREF